MSEAGWKESEPYPSRYSVGTHRLVGPTNLGFSNNSSNNPGWDGQDGLGANCNQLVLAVGGGLGGRLSRRRSRG